MREKLEICEECGKENRSCDCSFCETCEEIDYTDTGCCERCQKDHAEYVKTASGEYE